MAWDYHLTGQLKVVGKEKGSEKEKLQLRRGVGVGGWRGAVIGTSRVVFFK